jgi:heme oxygenase
MPAPSTLAFTSRADALRRMTRDTHERLDQAVMAQGIFRDRTRFARFLHVQYHFHADIAPLYARADLTVHFPHLAARARLAPIADDLRALGQEIPPAPRDAPSPPSLAAALGWLYVAEGSNLGAAVILKLASPLGLDAGFGASHLAPAAAGVASHWRDFTQALDAIALPAHAEADVVAGARAAFTRVHRHLRDAFA